MLTWHQLAGSALVGGITSSLYVVSYTPLIYPMAYNLLSTFFETSSGSNKYLKRFLHSHSVCGVVTVQTCLYYHRFPNDPWLLRFTVSTLVITLECELNVLVILRVRSPWPILQ